MAKTYRMTDETKQEAGHEVHRIVATKGNRWAVPGTIGGWMKIGPVEEKTIKEAITAYNKCCSKYMKHEYVADPAHILMAYKAAK